MELALASVTADNDDRLLHRVRSGDPDAFGVLVERYMRRAYFAALGLVGSPDDALDLSQEAFARAFQARTRLDPERPFYTWFYQILRRLCFNFNRDRRTRREKLREATPWLVSQASAAGRERSPEAQLSRNEQRERVMQALDAMPERDREILVLREFEDLRYREIAELLGVPMGTVMSRLYAARQRLAAALDQGEST